jgi:putative ABC transport system permease protein
MTTTTHSPRQLYTADLMRLSSVGLRTRKLRAALSALGIAIGVAAIVAVLGLSASSQAGLLAEIDSLGTNMLTVSNGQTLFGQAAELPTQAPAMVGRIAGVTAVQDTGQVSNATVYRSPLIPAIDTNVLTVQATSLGLLSDIGDTLAQGHFLNAATEREPAAVLGAVAAQRLGIDRVFSGERVWLNNQWFYVAGILDPAVLAPDIDTAVLVGYPAAESYLGSDGHPSTIYVRTQVDQVDAVQPLLARAANPESPSQVGVSQPSQALVARAAAKSALNGLFLGLGAVALLVGAIGVANIMVISVLERRSEIGLRRALGATRTHIRIQFLAEAVLLALIGGAIGVAVGAAATAIYAYVKGWATVIPTEAWAGGIGAAIAIGAIAGLLPALRAARMSPTQALWSI